MWTGSCFFIYSTEVGQTQSAEQAYFCVLWANRDESEASERHESRSRPSCTTLASRSARFRLCSLNVYIRQKSYACSADQRRRDCSAQYNAYRLFCKQFPSNLLHPEGRDRTGKTNLLFFCFMLIDITNKFPEFLFSGSGQIDQHFRTRVQCPFQIMFIIYLYSEGTY